ncbi:MAG: CHAT domain-containing protein [Prochloraceae cyanobacterium]
MLLKIKILKDLFSGTIVFCLILIPSNIYFINKVTASDENFFLARKSLKNFDKQQSKTDPVRSQGLEFYNLATEAEKKGNLKEAIQHLIQAQFYFSQSKDNLNYIVSSLTLSQIYIKTGVLRKAKPILDRMLILTKQQNLLELYAISRGLSGNYYLALSRYDEAILEYEKSLKIQEDPITLIALSETYLKKSNYLDKNRGISLDFSESPQIKSSSEKNLKKGYEFANLAVSLSTHPEDFINSRLNLLKYSEIFSTKEQFDNYKLEITDALKTIPDSSFKAFSLIALANLSDDNSAIDYLSESIKVVSQTDDRYNFSLANEELGKIYLSLGDYKAAKQYTETALEIAQHSNITSRMFYQFWQLAKIELRLGNKNNASNAYDLALFELKSRTGEFGFHDLLFELRKDARFFLREYVELLLEEKRLEGAIEVLSTLKLSEFQSYFNDPCIELSTYRVQQNNLDSETRIYSFITKDKTYFIIKSRQDISIREINISQQELTKLAMAYRKDLTFFYAPIYKENSIALYEILIKPIERDLRGDKITFINDGILRNIPMESLYNNEKQQYLLENYTIDYGSGVAFPSNLQDNSEEILLVGASEFSIQVSPLPGVENEINFLKQIYKNPLTLFNEDFTFEKFRQSLDKKKPSLIHIATHGVFGGNADNSYIVAYDKPIDLNQLGALLTLTVRPPSFLFLSACETAQGSPDAPLGISGTAFRAGTQNIMASLWVVRDNASAVFVKEFYQNYKQGKSIAEAKRAAQLSLLKGDFPHAGVWGAFINFKL